MARMYGIRAERLFAELCARSFLRGFVYHSPKYYSPTEVEAGDVVVWVRTQVVVFEVISREPGSNASTKSFAKRIGAKREQLVQDRKAYLDPSIEVIMKNEGGETVAFDKSELADYLSFAGVVVVDCQEDVMLHYQTVKLSLEVDFPLAIMTSLAFSRLLREIDTVPDLYFYLRDRWEFLQTDFPALAHSLLNLHCDTEENLIACYKMNENNFPVGALGDENLRECSVRYSILYVDAAARRDQENETSRIIDELIDHLRVLNNGKENIILFTWELATMSRRQRAYLAPRIQNALERMALKNPRRHFAFFNQFTDCWLVFYFQYGGGLESFKETSEILTRLKLFQVMRECNFQHSVYGYCFYKSELHTGSKVDSLKLTLEDAEDYAEVRESDYQESRKFFREGKVSKINEFPD